MPAAGLSSEEDQSSAYRPFYNPVAAKPVTVNEFHEGPLFTARPLFGPLLFSNNASDARDHCACERTFLSWLRLSVYLAIVSVAMILSFHLRKSPTRVERQMALPLGLIFWVLALLCLSSGLANYIKSVTKYSQRQALVQSGWKTETIFAITATAIVAACILLLATNVR